MARLFCVVDCMKPETAKRASASLTDAINKKLAVTILVNNNVHWSVKVITDDLLVSDGTVPLLTLLEKVRTVGETKCWADEEETTILIVKDIDQETVSNVPQIKDFIKLKRSDDWCIEFIGNHKLGTLLGLSC